MCSRPPALAVALAVALAGGCRREPCARHSDCAPAEVCTLEGVCAAPPDAGDGSAGDAPDTSGNAPDASGDAPDAQAGDVPDAQAGDTPDAPAADAPAADAPAAGAGGGAR